jgi:uncharacterized protein
VTSSAVTSSAVTSSAVTSSSVPESSATSSSAPAAAPFPLQATVCTRLVRGRHRAVDERSALHELLGTALLAHVGVDMGTHPVVLPCLPALDPDGPDEAGTLYLHGSVGAGWVRRLLAAGAPVCVTVTELDGVVLARSGFHHSMNYRCAVVIGTPRLVHDKDEKARALDLLVDQVVPGRSAHLRPHTPKELAATAVLAVPMAEASLKVRAGGPGDDPEDVAAGGWAGHVPLRLVADAPVSAPDAVGGVPDHVVAHVTMLARPAGAAPGGIGVQASPR